MSDYSKITDFAAKDALLTGNPAKQITGTAHNNEYNAIAVAIATKADTASPTFTGTVTAAIVTTTGALTAGSTLAVTGASTLSGAVTASSTLAVTGAATLSSTLAVTGASTLTGAVTNSALTASRAMVTDGSKVLTSSAVTATELGYVSGVTSAIQTQMNLKAALASPTFTGTVSGSAFSITTLSATVGAFTSSVTSGTTSANGAFVLTRYVDAAPYWYIKPADNTSGPNWLLYNAGTAVSALSITPNGAGTFASAVTATDFTISSDARKKEDIVPLRNAMDIVGKLDGVKFTYKDSHKPSVGFLAQQVEEVLPELVNFDADGYRSVSYGQVTAVLVEAFKELRAEVKLLKGAH